MTVFSNKLDRLTETIDLVIAADVSALSSALHDGKHRLAIAVGSGGSVGTAEFLGVCRTGLQAAPTLVQTPMQVVLELADLTGVDVWLFSARGDNPDVIGALRAAVKRGAAAIHVVTTNASGRLVLEASGAEQAHVHIVPVADPKDGFLATHSLIAASTALLRAADQCAVSPMGEQLEDVLSKTARTLLSAERRNLVATEFSSFTGLDVLLLLADPRLSPAAVTIETSCWEAAICPVQRTDFRNFAHGRHVWLAHRGNATFLLNLTGTDTRAAWQDIETLIPSDLRRVSIDYANCGRYQNFLAAIDALVIVEALGRVRGIDAGKPGVGPFATGIYEARSLEQLAARLTAPVRQKQAAALERDDPDGCAVDMVAEGAAVHQRFSAAEFGAVVLDYDGTVVSTEGRYGALRSDIVAEIERLLDLGCKVGFATGRGGSAGERLRCQLAARHHPQVLMGYYNGAYLRPLSVDIRVDRPDQHPAMADVMKWLRDQSGLFRSQTLDGVRDSGVQVSIEIRSMNDPEVFAALLNSKFGGSGLVRLVRSEHSLDICLSDTCKTKVVEAVAADVVGSSQVLCIGDSGGRLGNDHLLLGLPYGVSVHHVCDRPDVCWSFFGAGVTGPDALLRILRALRGDGIGQIRLVLQDLIGG
jgi:hypothetical protein